MNDDSTEVLQHVRIEHTDVYIQLVRRTFDQGEEEEPTTEDGLRFVLGGAGGRAEIDPHMPLTKTTAANIIRMLAPFV